MSENLKFTYLKAIGIILVVLGHTSGGGGILPVFLDGWFPIYSFHMPLFVFVAGYFYQEALSTLEYMRKRFSRLVIPFYGWNLFYGILVTILVLLGITNIGNPITLENFFINPWTKGDSYYAFNYASWFLIWLFTVQVAYMVIRKAALRVHNEYFMMVGCLVAGLLGTYLSTIGFESQLFGATLIKLLFGLPFIQLGYLYRAKLEKYGKPSLKSFVLVFIIQLSLIVSFKGEFPFTFVVAGGQFENVFLPLVTSFTGIWVWLQICTFLSDKIGANRIIRYLGNHTLDIMVHHMFAFWLLNTLFFVAGAPNFDVGLYRTLILYEYLPFGDSHFLIFYTLAGIIIPLAIYKLVSSIKKKLNKRFFGKNILSSLNARGSNSIEET